MRKNFFIFVTVFLLLYGLLNFYIGKSLLLAGFNRLYFWPIFWLISFSYIIARFSKNILPKGIILYLRIIGSYWLGAMFYFFLTLFSLDIFTAINNVLRVFPEDFRENTVFNRYLVGALILLIISILILGRLNAINPRISKYNISISSKKTNLKALSIAMVSDLHLGIIVNNKGLTQMVNLINSQNPELILMPGDIIDEDIKPFIEEKMELTFKKLNPKYGIYGVPGNHEYIGGNIDKAIKHLELSGIKILRDETVKIGEDLYIVGRDDPAAERFSDKSRKDYSSLFEGIDTNMPVIMMNHQPIEFDKGSKTGADLLLSGHTHRGQLFPNNLITKKLFKNDWGHSIVNGMHIIVSCGYGTWGPPIRIGNRPEIVMIHINFVDR
jgi:predicted MPP superfamily phosphohydrolase